MNYRTRRDTQIRKPHAICTYYNTFKWVDNCPLTQSKKEPLSRVQSHSYLGFHFPFRSYHFPFNSYQLPGSSFFVRLSPSFNFLILGHVPLFDRAIKSGRDHATGRVIPIGRHHLPLVACHRREQPPVAAAPHPGGAVKGRRQEGFSGGVKLALRNQVAVGGQHVRACFRPQVPNPHAVVVASGRHLEAVGREVPAHDALHVAHQRMHLNRVHE
jgi:hypothetical protein